MGGRGEGEGVIIFCVHKVSTVSTKHRRTSPALSVVYNAKRPEVL